MIGLISFPIFLLREYVKYKNYNDYKYTPEGDFETIPERERQAFRQGCKAPKSYYDQCKSLFFYREGYAHPGAYYAGMYVSENATEARKDNDPVSETLLTSLAGKISKRAL